ncbi:MAG: leucyl aminopeptidase family protein [Candidatus Sungbacteria bacterium]|nr:leucyl aminopeptidase family protein [Candidatus Sungbacteria bacterium]
MLEEAAIKKLGMGGVLGVSKGSDEKPQFIIMEYKSPKADKKSKPLVFAGKGVTFDTGGLNIKTGDYMYEMHMDMAGGAAVMHALSAIARMKLPVHIIGLIPAVENMPSGSSYHPGDILKTITGKTIEVLNTDAEGRVILADALGYAQRFNPKLILDVATLTGAAMVAVGQRAIALFSTSEKLELLMRQIGKVSGDTVWPLPMGDEYFDEIKGTFGDVANTGKSRYGGATSGAIFLKQFVGEFPFVHLDIAPTMTTIEGQFLAKGSSGSGVRFLVELAKEAERIPNSE